MQEAVAILSEILFLSILVNIILFVWAMDESYKTLTNEIENYKAKTAHLMEIQNHLERQMSRLEHYIKWQSKNLKDKKQ